MLIAVGGASDVDYRTLSTFDRKWLARSLAVCYWRQGNRGTIKRPTFEASTTTVECHDDSHGLQSTSSRLPFVGSDVDIEYGAAKHNAQ